jgi:hypothetical protein
VEVRLKGNIQMSGRVLRSRVKTSFTGKLSPKGARCAAQSLDACLVGKLKVRLCLRARGRWVCDAFQDKDATPIPVADGAWSLDLNVVDMGSGDPGGTATASLGTTRPPNLFDYDITGSYNASKDRSELSLQPVAAAGMGTWVKLEKTKVAAGNLTNATITFKLLGQKGAVKIPQSTCCSVR